MAKKFKKYLRSFLGRSGPESKDPPTYDESQAIAQALKPLTLDEKKDTATKAPESQPDVAIFLEELAHRHLGEVQETRLSDRYSSTGSWLLQTPEYLQWWENDSSSLVWFHGRPGVGKSVLAAVLVDDLQKRMTKSDISKEKRPQRVALSYAFFNYKFSGTEDALHLVQNIIHQVGSHHQGPPSYGLIELSEKRSSTYEDYVNGLLSVASEFDEIMILLDALDECEEGALDKILSLVGLLLSHETCRMKIIFSSRPAPRIKNFFGEVPSSVKSSSLEVYARKEDIGAYVEHTIMDDTKKKMQEKDVWDDEGILLEQNRLKAIKDITEKSSGVFLWAKMQAAQLLRLDGKEIPTFLSRMPLSTDMIHTYLRIVKDLAEKPAREREVARKCILWLTYFNIAEMRMEFLQHIATPWDELMDSENIFKQNPVRELLENLLRFEEGNSDVGTVEWVHFSAKEFFRSRPAVKMSPSAYATIKDFFPTRAEAEMEIGKHSIRYINTVLTEKAPFLLGFMAFFPLEFPLAWYCCQFFDSHLRRAQNLLDKDAECKQYLKDFIESDDPVRIVFMKVRAMDSFYDMLRVGSFSKFSAEQVDRDTLARITGIDELLGDEYKPTYQVDQAELHKFDGWVLKHAVQARDGNLVNRVLDNAPDKYIRRIDGRGATALYYAAKSGNYDLCERLILDGRIGVDDGDPLSSPLQAAAFNGHRAVVQLLIEHGANVGFTGGLYNTPLQAAATNKQFAVVAYLLKRKRAQELDLNRHEAECEANHCCALYAAASEEDEETVLYLLEHGADPNLEPKCSEYGFPLQVAAERGNIDIITALLKHGADPNAVTDSGELGTAFNAAAYRNQVEVMKLLLNLGANIHLSAGMYGTPLQTALQMGHVEAVRFLLEKGARATDDGGKYGTTLKAAVTSGKHELVEEIFRLNPDADVNATPGYFMSALVAAAKDGTLDTVKLLVEKGADLNTVDNFSYGTALDQAVHLGKTAMVEYLLEKGADIGDAMIEAAGGKQEILQLFLDKGVDVNYISYRANYYCPLQSAAWRGKSENIRLLLSRGADPNLGPGGVYGNALTAAIVSADQESIKLLLDAGADINSTGGKYGTPLQAACQKIHEETVIYLLSRGADVNVVTNRKHATALQKAAYKGFLRIVERLCEKGARDDVGGQQGTALYIATKARNENLVSLLLEKAKNVDLENRENPMGETMVELAERMEEKFILPLLLKYKAKQAAAN